MPKSGYNFDVFANITIYNAEGPNKWQCQLLRLKNKNVEIYKSSQIFLYHFQKTSNLHIILFASCRTLSWCIYLNVIERNGIEWYGIEGKQYLKEQKIREKIILGKYTYMWQKCQCYKQVTVFCSWQLTEAHL